VFFHADASVGSVALGFQSIQQTFLFLDGTGVQSSLADAIDRIQYQTPITNLTILGHSLGGALATLTAAELAVRNSVGIKSKINVTTYASPRVGLLDFSDWFNHNIPSSSRIWNGLDIVPQTPTFPSIHVGESYELEQTAELMAALSKTPACEHNLSNYQWLLDPQRYKLTSGCDATQDEDVSSAVRATGAQKLSLARLAGT
jgi:alpha-beta hydrolase superfamily lysophospholipase